MLIKANKLKRTVGGQIEPRTDQHVAGLAEVSKLCCSFAASGKRRADIKKKKSLIEITTKCNHCFFKEKNPSFRYAVRYNLFKALSVFKASACDNNYQRG